MYLSKINTKIGPMLAMADENKLYLLEFENRHNLEKEIEQLKLKTKSSIITGKNKILDSIESELNQYFEGTLKEFKTPIHFSGTQFQQIVWKELQKIPYGDTRSYADIAKAIGNPSAFRAVGNANGSNQLAIIIPCHRVINSNGNLCGYAAGIDHKKWLLNLEKQG
jgi:AraC family transcriptional regulator, regulatory protein of adaptative response / methylated-DNA-[protein]-cysteine methyltransferase